MHGGHDNSRSCGSKKVRLSLLAKHKPSSELLDGLPGSVFSVVTHLTPSVYYGPRNRTAVCADSFAAALETVPPL